MYTRIKIVNYKEKSHYNASKFSGNLDLIDFVLKNNTV